MFEDRYKYLRVENTMKTVPFVTIETSANDKYEEFVVGVTRFDILANKYYQDPTLGWLIAMANPQRRLEFDFEDGDIVRIPFPKDVVLANYNEKIKEYHNL